MPTYKNVAPRIVGVHVSKQMVLVEPGRTVECTESEAEPQVKKGALTLLSGHSSDAAPAPAPKPPGEPKQLAEPTKSAPSGRTSRPKAEPKE